MTWRPQFGGLWLMAALLLAAVLIPTACLIYFLNEAAQKERSLANRELSEAYSGQLRLVARQINEFWEQRGRSLDARPESETPARFFEHCVRDGLADSVIVLDRDGSPAYPSLVAAPRQDATLQRPAWAEARALEASGKAEDAASRYLAIAKAEPEPELRARASQAYIRCIVSLGRRRQAAQAIDEWFGALRLLYTTDLSGRLVTPDEFLLQIQLNAGNEQRLFGLVQNYANPLPSTQRLFLMDALRAMKIEQRFRTFPTYQAERTAERFLSDGRTAANDNLLRLTGTAELWAMTSPGKSVIALYGTPTIKRQMERFIGQSSGGRILLDSGAPPPGAETVSRMPGWWIRFDRAAPAGRGDAERQIAVYGWIGLLAVTSVAVLAVAGGIMLRRQMRIAHLKTDLVAAVSHELRTPLTSMKALVESLLSKDDFDAVRTREYLQMIARENSRLSRLIENFLTFSRMERNRGRFDFARVQPGDVVRAAVDSVGERFVVATKIPRTLPALYADEDAMVTVLLNLLDNAYKYTGENRHIVLSARQEDGWVRFSVEDNGIGIPPREQNRIFRRFYQVDRRLSRHAGGVGLGLSIVEFIVKAHGGAVSVESRPGLGSTFTVSLPVAGAAKEVVA